jgi:hypothetical protein
VRRAFTTSHFGNQQPIVICKLRLPRERFIFFGGFDRAMNANTRFTTALLSSSDLTIEHRKRVKNSMTHQFSIAKFAPHERIPEIHLETEWSASDLRTATGALLYLLSDSHSSLSFAGATLDQLQKQVSLLARAAFGEGDSAALLEAHRILFTIYELSFGNPLSRAVAHEHCSWLVGIREVLETAYLASELPRVQIDLPKLGSTPDAICEWFEAHARKQSLLDRKVVKFLEQEATLEQFVIFILSDGYLNYRFYDALVLSLLHYSETVKSEIIRHMWDECGCGNSLRSHTRQFSSSLDRLGLTLPSPPFWDDWRPYAGYNLYFLFGLNRQHYFKAIGSLAMPELFDPDRDRSVVEGLRRLGFEPATDFEYYQSHIEGDEAHGPSWLNHVIRPIVQVQPYAAHDLAIGGALRMIAMSRYNEYLALRFDIVEESDVSA